MKLARTSVQRHCPAALSSALQLLLPALALFTELAPEPMALELTEPITVVM